MKAQMNIVVSEWVIILIVTFNKEPCFPYTHF